MATAYIFYGGSFSPPTNAHIIALKQSAELVHNKHPDLPVIGVFVPVSSNYNKNSVRLPDSDEHRIQMLKIAAAWLTEHEESPNIKYEVSDHEIKLGTSVPTIDSLNMFKYIYGHENIFYLLLGEDNMKQILENKWKLSNELLKNPILLLQRPGYNINTSKYPNIISFELHGINANISSTKLRSALKTGNNISSLTIEPIVEYIISKRLYKNNVGGFGFAKRSSSSKRSKVRNSRKYTRKYKK